MINKLMQFGFAYGFYDNNTNIKFNEKPTQFLKFCKTNILNCESLTRKEISQKIIFSDIELKAINNGLKLSRFIQDNKIIDSKILEIEWVDSDIHNYEIIVNKIPFSINSNLYKYRNIQLYKLLNTISQKDIYDNTLHIFEEFGINELQSFFLNMRNLSINELSKKSYERVFPAGTKVSYSKSTNKLYFFYKGYEEYIENFSTIEYKDFFNNITSTYLKLFTDFIEERLLYENEYIKLKEEYLNIIKNNLNIFIETNNNINLLNNILCNIFRIIDEEYYILKLNQDKVTCFKIPDKNSFNNRFQTNNINIEVKESNLNLNLLVKSTEQTSFEINSIINYQNGEFNGIPVIKLVTNIDILSKVYYIL